MFLLSLFLLALFFVDCNGDITPINGCHEVSMVQNFQIERMMGRWYEILRVANEFQANEKCTYFVLELHNNNSYTVDGHTILEGTGARQHWHATATFIGNKSRALVDLEFPSRALITNGNATIVDTDYINFAVVHECLNLNSTTSFTQAALLSRTPWIEQAYFSRGQQILDKINIPRDTLIPTDQLDCPLLST